VEPNKDDQAENEQVKLDEAARRPLSELCFDLGHRTKQTVARTSTHAHDHDRNDGHHHHSHRRDRARKPKTSGTSTTSGENDQRQKLLQPTLPSPNPILNRPSTSMPGR
jgi:hypothetical protein